MLKIPYGINDYKKLIENGYYYVDKTMYLQKLEDAGDVLTYLRPGRFGKTLFTSLLYYYYDINSKDLFDDLFKNTYIYNNPTKNKNNYYILKLDFSGMTVSSDRSDEQLEESFKTCVVTGILKFLGDYGFDYQFDKSIDCADILKYFLTYIYTKQLNNKIYLIIDEYDNFTNAVLKGEGDRFKEILSSEGFVHSFYASIKEYTGTVIDRVFMTGICPITLNAMTTGFNISTDISSDVRFNSMIGLTHDEVRCMLKNIEKEKQEEVFNIMVKNYDGYLFNKDTDNRVFNATLVMYFMREYLTLNKIPEDIIDTNISFNYDKIENCLKLQNNKYYEEILEIILKNNTIDGSLTRKFNLEIDFTKDDIVSLIYYFGYLTIDKEIFSGLKFKIPNYVMKEVYGEFFLKILNDADIRIDISQKEEYLKEILLEGKINKITDCISKTLKQIGNRSIIKFDEKYIQMMYFSFLMSSRDLNIYLEYPSNDKYIDVMIMRNGNIGKYDIMIELKYIKVSDYNKNRNLINEKKKEAINQIKSYSLDERISEDNLKKYIVIFIGNNVKVIEKVV